jgi:hypothetical protein
VIGTDTRITAPFLLDRVKRGNTVRVHGVNRVEIDLYLGFGIKLSKLFELDGVSASSVPVSYKSAAVHCLVVLLGGKRVLVQPENEKPTCKLARVFLNERIYGSPVGLVTNVDHLDHPILDVTPFFCYLAEHGFDVRRVHEVLNRRGEKR